jgi:hypothetical protein
MSSRRKDDDPTSRTRFRTDRVVNDNGKWYFLTREGRVEGPFECQAEALEHLEIYVRVVQSGLLTEECNLTLCS